MKIKNNRFLIFFISGFAFITVGVFIVLTMTNVKKRNTKDNGNIIAPYYHKKVLELSSDFKTKATESSVIAEKKIKIPIIMYHYVEYVKDINDIIKKRLDINPTLFERQLKTLAEAGYQTYFVKNIPDIIEGKINYSTKSAVLTFDDGYEDFYTVVFPILKKYKMKATIYIIYEFVGRKGFMNQKEIKEVLGSGLIELGSHTLDHIYLKLAPQSVAKKQVIESKKKLEELFGVEVKTFAYPYGAFSKITVDFVKEAGYTAAVSVIPGMTQSKENLFYLSRVRAGFFNPQTMIDVIERYKK